ncbi:MAG: YaeQ family protein [Planctomycetia bacterium]
MRLAQHKSESDDYLVTRVLAWCLCAGSRSW